MSLYFKDKNKISFKVGIFTICVIILFVISYSYLNDLIDKHKYSSIKVLFSNINNLEPGNSVTINGLKKGRVKEIKVVENGILATIYVDIDFPLKEGTLFITKESDIMGNHQIDIIPGSKEALLNVNEIQNGYTREGFTDLIYRMNSMAENVERIFTKLEKADNLLENLNSFLENSNTTFTKIDRLISNPDKNDIKTIVQNLNHSTKELSHLLSNNKEQISQAVRQSNTTLTNINYTLATVDTAMIYLNQVAKNINSENSSVGALINDKTLYNNLLKSSQKVDSLLIDVKKNPRKYFRISIF